MKAVSVPEYRPEKHHRSKSIMGQLTVGEVSGLIAVGIFIGKCARQKGRISRS